MKTIKSIFVTILIFVAVKACFYVSNSASEMSEDSSVSSNPTALPETPVGNAAVASSGGAGVDVAAKEDAQGYRRHTVGYGVSLAIPQDWYVLPNEQVTAVRAAADSIYSGGDSSKATPFAANSSSGPQPHKAQVRISFVDTAFGESDLRTASAADLQGVCGELESAWQQNPSSPRLIGRPQCSVASLNGRAALLTHYRRSGQDSETTWSVDMMQVPLEAKTAMITFSQMDDSADARQVITDITASLRFD